MFAFYMLMPLLISASSATLVNLTLLTADLYSLFAGIYLFHYTVSIRWFQLKFNNAAFSIVSFRGEPIIGKTSAKHRQNIGKPD